MKKLIMLIATFFCSTAMSSEQSSTYGDWTKSADYNGYVSTEMVTKNLQGILNTGAALRFGMIIPMETCYMSEAYSEPFGNLMVLGTYNNFVMQCVDKGIAIAFPESDAVNEGMVDTLVKGQNICVSEGEHKFCFSSNGVKELQESIKDKS
ncbi:hypothetical protein P3596_02305 [Vibrio parahaemolyticus]|nr:hypothetical protein [Vibrio parahaemolyticus]